jgi:hypothetical protein
VAEHLDERTDALLTGVRAFQADHHDNITQAFRDFGERWKNIFLQQQTHWYQAGKEWQLATTQDGHLSWEPSPKSFEATMQDFTAALEGMKTGREQRDMDRSSPARQELEAQRRPEEVLYAALDGMQHDGPEHANIQTLAQLHDRLDEMQQAQEQERSHEHGRGF